MYDAKYYMRRNKMNRIFIGILAFVMSFIVTGYAFAEETSVEVKANFSPQTISFEIDQCVTATTSEEDPTKLDITPLTIKNNMSTGSIDITAMRAEGENGYSVVADGSEIWKEVAIDTKKLSIQATVDSELCDLSGEGFSGGINIPRESSVEILLSGHTAAVSCAVSGVTAANIITTVALHD